MSKFELKRTIRREIRDLNWRIDMKIVRGLSYRSEARRHKLLLMQLDRLDRLARAARRGFVERMAGAVASFML